MNRLHRVIALGVIAAGAKWTLVWQGNENADGIAGTNDGGLLFAQEQINQVSKLDKNGKFSAFLTNGHGRPWAQHGFQNAWKKAMRRAGVVDRTFHDSRGTAVTRLNEAGCTPQQTAAITGHSLRDVGTILDRYSARTDALAIAASANLERGRG